MLQCSWICSQSHTEHSKWIGWNLGAWTFNTDVNCLLQPKSTLHVVCFGWHHGRFKHSFMQIANRIVSHSFVFLIMLHNRRMLTWRMTPKKWKKVFPILPKQKSTFGCVKETWKNKYSAVIAVLLHAFHSQIQLSCVWRPHQETTRTTVAHILTWSECSVSDFRGRSKKTAGVSGLRLNWNPTR